MEILKTLAVTVEKECYWKMEEEIILWSDREFSKTISFIFDSSERNICA